MGGGPGCLQSQKSCGERNLLLDDLVMVTQRYAALALLFSGDVGLPPENGLYQLRLERFRVENALEALRLHREDHGC